MTARTRLLLALVLWLWSSAVAVAGPHRSNDFDVIFVDADGAMKGAIHEARRTLKTDFFARLEHPEGAHSFMLKIAVPIGDGRHEHVWVGDIRRLGQERGAGKLGKAPKWFGGRAGATLLFHENEISDWRFMLDGKMHGARTTRVLLQRLDRDRAEPLRQILAPLE